ncbi:MAG: tetratricopeptide repeat protein [Gammaproteobacteria bacterium]|nr:tetratricopeptide repeat protein [Gammaproteobacteria bacterium]MDH5801990.1 tetratricopeptide repeat protein [Gammaproteobacteria bacterium]
MKLSRNLILLINISVLTGCGAMARQPDTGQDQDVAQLNQKDLITSEAKVDDMQFEPALLPKLETRIAPQHLYRLLLAEISAQRGHLDVAVRNYLDVATETKDPKVAERAAQVASYSQDVSKMLSAARLWVELDAENPQSFATYAGALLKIGRAAEAVEQYQKMLQHIDDTARGFSAIVSRLSREPDRSLAITVMEKVVEDYRDNYEALFAYAHLAMRHVNFDLALTTLDQVLKLKANWDKAVILRARVLALQGEGDTALSFLKTSLDGDLEKNADVRMSYARMLFEARKYDAALAQFIRLSELHPKHADANYFSGVLAVQLKKPKLASEHLLKVRELGLHRAETSFYLGQAAEQLNDYKDAINYYLGVRHGEYYFNAQLRVISLMSKQQDYASARNHIGTVRVESEKQQIQLFLVEGDLLRETKKYPEAKQFYSDILTKFPKESSVRYARALIAEKLGELALVESDLLEILKEEPENAQVLNALGYTLADRTSRYEEALTYIKRAFELQPNDAAVIDSMGWVQYQMGNYKTALSHLQRANELTQDPEIAAHLGEVLWVMGNKSQALETWENSLKTNPDHEALRSVMKRFGL